MCWRYVWAVVLHSYVICRPCCHWFGSQTAGTDLSVFKFGWPLCMGRQHTLKSAWVCSTASELWHSTTCTCCDSPLMVCALSLHLCDVTARAAHGCKLRLNAFDTHISWKTCIATGYVFGQLSTWHAGSCSGVWLVLHVFVACCCP